MSTTTDGFHEDQDKLLTDQGFVITDELTADACKAPEVDPRRAATLAELHRVVQNTSHGHDLPAAIIHLAIRMESAARMDARSDPEFDWRLITRANDRRFNALRRLVYAAATR